MSNYIDNIFPINILDVKYLYTITSIYGDRIHPKTGKKQFHKGIDLGGRLANGTPIYAPYNGILKTSIDKKGGNIATIEHDANFKTRYMHLQSFYKTSGYIKQGDIIGFLGNTGSSSTGPHLHFEVWENGKHVDPAPYLFGWTLIKNDKKKTFSKSIQKYSKYGYNVPERDELKKFPIHLNDTQISNAEKIIELCKTKNITKDDAVLAIMCALQESSLLNKTETDLNDRDSIGLYAQRPSMGWGSISDIKNIEFATDSFFYGRTTNIGLLSLKNRGNLSKAVAIQKIQKSKYPDAYSKHEEAAIKIVNILWNDYEIEGYEDETELDEDDIIEKIDVQDKVAPGIWQIVKVIIDPEVKELQLNDASISMQQGSLYSFFEKICQKPFVEFFGDTYGDQYYFIIRKPPFTKQSFNSLPTYFIAENEVYNDSLKWNDDNVYSWFQLIPNGNYIGANERIWQYLKAVFFEEYAEIWGSRPLSITSNYITFQKSNGEIVEKQAILDLKFIIDIHSYLPFTRKGTITIKGDRRLKRGMRIYYQPTNEYFYIDSVQQTFSSNNGFLDRITILQVSHGMVKENCEIDIEDKFTKSYFNIINYGNNLYETLNEKQEATETDFDKHIPELVALFNNDKDSFTEEDIDEGINEWYLNNENENAYNLNISNDNELKITKKIYTQNFERCKETAIFLEKHRSIKINLIGTTDFHASNSYNIDLGKRRAQTIKNIIIENYRDLLKYHGNQDLINKEINKLKERINCISTGEEASKAKTEGIKLHDNSTNVGRLFNRSVLCKIDKNKIEENNKKEQDEKNIKNPDNGKWHVNREVFTYFLRREQFY